MRFRVALGAMLLGSVLSGATPDAGYREAVNKWREQREAALKAPSGWLTVAGLFWLREGENRCGADPGAEISLPVGRAPSFVGVFEFRAGKVVLRRAGSAAAVFVNGRPLEARASLRPDTAGKPDVVTIGDFTMFVIERGPKVGIRMRDLHSEMRRDFHGLQWYPVQESYRITAKFVSYAKPRPLVVPNILGQTEEQPSPGYASFVLAGREIRLYPTLEGDQLFYVFRDLTSRTTTYGAGRFLYSSLPKDGAVELDFNKAYNPPCAFTPFATCPLPPKENRLNVSIDAGEKRYGDH